MQLKVGDRVRFLNEVGGGEIVAQIDARTVMVRSADGFEIPTLLSELILDRPMVEPSRPAAPSPSQQAEPQKPVTVVAPPAKADPHIALLNPIADNCALVLGFSPHDDNDSLAGPFDMYVINEGQQRMLISLARWDGNRVVNVFAGKLKPNSARLVTTIKAADLFLYAMLHVQAIYYGAGPMELRQPESYDVEVKRTKFTRPGAFQSNRYLDLPLVTITVTDAQREAMLAASAPEAIEASKAVKDVPEVKPPKPEPPREEVVIDLHLEALCPQPLSFTPKEALDFQLRHFERALQEALQQPAVKRFVAIHGVGNGRLRREVIDVLRAKYHGCSYQDASFKEYGYGATLVHLVRNPSVPRK